MRLLEYQGRTLLDKAGINLPEGQVVQTPEDARSAALELETSVAIKAQVPVGGRGKAGGIKIVDTPEQASTVSSDLLGSDLKGETINELLVVEAVTIEQELYLSVILDRENKRPVIIFSTSGGVDIEQIAEDKPDAIHSQEIDPLIGLRSYQIRELLYSSELNQARLRTMMNSVRRVYDCFEDYGATLVEINPFVFTSNDDLLALDSKVIIDDESRAREEIVNMLPMDQPAQNETELERRASELGLQYVELEGNIGVIGNGAGLVMSTLDVLSQRGGDPANFLDVGGGADAQLMEDSYSLVTSKSGVEGVLVNIFGGITRCDKIAQGVVDALDKSPADLPLVVRLTGTNEDAGREILNDYGIASAEPLNEAADEIIARVNN